MGLSCLSSNDIADLDFILCAVDEVEVNEIGFHENILYRSFGLSFKEVKRFVRYASRYLSPGVYELDEFNYWLKLVGACPSEATLANLHTNSRFVVAVLPH